MRFVSSGRVSGLPPATAHGSLLLFAVKTEFPRFSAVSTNNFYEYRYQPDLKSLSSVSNTRKVAFILSPGLAVGLKKASRACR
jgi:hypothetical protein